MAKPVPYFSRIGKIGRMVSLAGTMMPLASS